MIMIFIRVVLLGLCFAVVHSQTGCRTIPSDSFKTLKDGCVVNVGACSMNPCLQCTSVERQCCGPVFERVIARCSGEPTYSRVKECKCIACEQPRVYISGIIRNCPSDCENLKIKFGNRIITNADATGKFSFSTDYPKTNRVVFVIIDDLKIAFPRSIIIETRRNKRAYLELFIYLQKGKTITSFDSNTGATYTPDNSVPVQFSFEGGSFTNEDGTLFNGMVTGQIDFIAGSSTNIPAPLIAEPEDGSDPGTLSSSGMVQLIFTTPSGERLNAKVNVQLNTDGMTPDEIVGMGIWLLDLETGYWRFLRSMTPVGTKRRKKRQTSDTLEGELNITANAIQIFNLDALVRPYCYTKVRTFLNEVDEAKQLSNIRIEITYFRVNGTGANFIVRETDINGACVPIQCNVKILENTIIQIFSEGDVRAVKMNLPLIYDSLFIVRSNVVHNMTMITNTSAVQSNGPIYSSYSKCNNASFTDFFFGFNVSEPENALVETNAIDINEENINSPWIEDLFSWWPNRTTFRACYLEIGLIVSSGLHTFKIQSFGGTHSITQGKEYGTRSVTQYGNNACVEYKCPGTLSDGEYDRTRIVVTVSNAKNHTFILSSVEQQLYSQSEYPSIVNQTSNNSPNFDALVPNIESAYGNGVYFDENISPSLAKAVVLAKCPTGNRGVTFRRKFYYYGSESK